MLPEHVWLELEPERAQRILRKLLAKLSDLEADTARKPSLHRKRQTNETHATANSSRAPDTSGGLNRRLLVDKDRKEAGMPPAHPFEHLLLQKSRKKPRYTYRGKRAYLSGNSSDSSDTCGPLPRRADDSLKKQRCRSPSIESLSDTDISSFGQDPALWLTTPRKKLQRRLSSDGGPGGMQRSLSAASDPPSFSARVEILGAHSLARPSASAHAVDGQRAKSLFSYLVHLGETLWLDQSTAISKKTRALPLKVATAFRTGQAIACSDGYNDIDYLDDVYRSIPQYLLRFVLWQHVVTLCFIRAPAYTDTVSAALWQVDAFYQQEYIIMSRLSALGSLGSLLKTSNIAPLHLRAKDIGVESRFIAKLLQRISSERASAISRHGMCGHREDSLWMQFVSAGTRSKAVANDGLTGDEEHASADLGTSAGIRDTGVSGLPRYAKWVARISSPIASARILALALCDVVEFITHRLTSPCCANVEAADGIPTGTRADIHTSIDLALQSLKAICSIIYTKLGSATISSTWAMGVEGDFKELHQGIAMLDSLVHLAKRSVDKKHKKYKNSTLDGSHSGFSQPRISAVRLAASSTYVSGIYRLGVLYQTGLTLLSLCWLKDSCRPRSSLAAVCSATDGSMAAGLIQMAQRLLRLLLDTNASFVGNGVDGGAISSRSSLAARFGALVEQSLSQPPEMLPIDHKVWRALVLPLAVAGTSPELFIALAQLVADDLGDSQTASAIARLVKMRFDAIWSHYCDCCAWQAGWSSAQSHEEAAFEAPAAQALEPLRSSEAAEEEENGAAAAAANSKDSRLKESVLLQLENLTTRLMQGSTTKNKSRRGGGTSKTRYSSDVVEDELGLLLTRRLSSQAP